MAEKKWYEVWKRNTRDPLMRTFLDKYKLHLLALPSQETLIGQICVYREEDLIGRDSMTLFLEQDYQIPPVTSTKMGDIEGKLSQAVSIDIGLGLLENFLSSFGIGSVIQKVHLDFQSRSVHTLKFAFDDTLRNTISVVKIAKDLIGKTFAVKENHPLFSETNKYYLVTGEARTTSLSIEARNQNQQTLDFDIEVWKTIDVSGERSIKKLNEDRVVFKGEYSLAFGTELHELNYDLDKRTFKINGVKKFVNLRGQGSDEKRSPSLIGDPIEGNIFLNLI